VAVVDSLHLADEVEKSLAAEAAERLRAFRGELYDCLGLRADELFELTDALLCADGPVHTLVGLCLAPEHRRGHGALYDAVNVGRVDVERLRRVLAGLPLSRMFGGRIVLAVDATPWLRPDAETCPERLFCHVYGHTRESDQLLPGWPYQLVAVLESGPTSWTALLDAVRLGPAEDVTAVTADQLRGGRAAADRRAVAGRRSADAGGTRCRLRRVRWPTCRWSRSGGFVPTGSCSPPSLRRRPAGGGRPAGRGGTAQ
jgi:hypothetical protein